MWMWDWVIEESAYDWIARARSSMAWTAGKLLMSRSRLRYVEEGEGKDFEEEEDDEDDDEEKIAKLILLAMIVSKGARAAEYLSWMI